MDIKNLMIGDWVYNKHHGKNIRLTPYDFFTHTHNEFGEQELAPFAWPTIGRDLEPIPLTPEILEKNGWIKTKYAYGRDCMEIHGADELPEGVDNALSMARWSIDKNFQYHFLDLYMWKGSVMKHDVHYVHQLQQAMRIMGCDKEIEL